VAREFPDLRFYVVFALWRFMVVLKGHWARHVRGTAGGFDLTVTDLEVAAPALAAHIRPPYQGQGETCMVRSAAPGDPTVALV
jgi:hypothetical protein